MKHSLLLAVCSLMLVACNAQTPATDTGTSDQPVAAKRVPMEWNAYAMPEKDGIPQNTLKLKTVEPVRQTLFETTCAGTTQVADIADLADSAAYIRCWWAGGGDDFAVFIEDSEKAVIRHRTVDEQAGYGDWEDLKSL
jgi:hypothetical protein